MKKLEPYAPEIEEQMKNLCQSLSEKDRRRYAGIEAKKLGYGGISYVCRVLGCDESSVNRGIAELEEPLSAQEKRVQNVGGGRKAILQTTLGIHEAFLEITSPIRPVRRWMRRSNGAI